MERLGEAAEDRGGEGVLTLVRLCVRLKEEKKNAGGKHTVKTPGRLVCIGNTSGVFQSRSSLLAQALIRLSAFKPTFGEDKIEFTRETKMEEEKGEE